MAQIIDAFTEKVRQADVRELDRAYAQKGCVLCERTCEFRQDLTRCDRQIRRGRLSPDWLAKRNKGWAAERAKRIGEHEKRIWAQIALQAGLSAIECRRYLQHNSENVTISEMARVEGISRQGMQSCLKKAKAKLKRYFEAELNE